METKIKKRLLLFVLVILTLPLLQHNFQFIKSGALIGGFVNAADVDFSIAGWFEGKYQDQKDQYLNDNTGFRADLVRVNNQIDFSLFDRCHAGWTLTGLHNNLFQWPYIDAYYGRDFAGYDLIRARSVKLKALQDTLLDLNKTLILVFSPSKATFFPEDFPRERVQKKGVTNFDVYMHMADSLGINHIDMETWFLSMKGKSKELLFSKQGIHWTNYGVTMAGDSLMRYIEAARNIHMPHPSWSRMEHTTEPRDGDDDIASELNLIFKVTTETFAYPIVESVPDSGLTKPNVIYVGDSYAFKMVRNPIVNTVNGQCEYWGYFDDVHEINNNSSTYIRNNYDWKGAMKKADCIVVQYTAFNLQDLGNGFIEAAYDYYFPQAK